MVTQSSSGVRKCYGLCKVCVTRESTAILRYNTPKMLRATLINGSRSSVRPALIARRRVGNAPCSPTNGSSRKLLCLVLYSITFSAIRIFQTLVQYAYLIVPVRSYAGSIPSSVGLPISVLANSLCVSAAQAFRSQHDFDQPRDAQEGVFDCRSDKKSASACDIARRNRIPSSDMRPLCQVIRLLINFR